MRIIKLLSFIIIGLANTIVFEGCGIIDKRKYGHYPNDVKTLEFVQQFEVPHNKIVDSTMVGGLSGITYDNSNKTFYLLSDDRSHYAPSRMYSMKWKGKNRVETIEIKKTILLKNNMSKSFPSKTDYIQLIERKKRGKYSVIDPEDLTYSSKSKQFYWVSEGENDTLLGKEIILNPSIQIMDKEGNYIGVVNLPKELKFSKESGPQRNKSLESITLSPSEEFFFITTERPLLQDIVDLDSYDTGMVKIYQFRTSTRSVENVYAYPLNIPNDPITAANNLQFGVSAMLSINDSTLLVLERLYIPQQGNKARIYKVILGRENILQHRKLVKNPKDFIPLSKELLVELHEVAGLRMDNVEGMSWGPVVNGKKTLWIVSDNNFSEKQYTFIYQFNVVEK